MNFDLSDPHTAYVVAAYSVAAIGYGALVLHTYFKWRALAKISRQP